MKNVKASKSRLYFSDGGLIVTSNKVTNTGYVYGSQWKREHDKNTREDDRK